MKIIINIAGEAYLKLFSTNIINNIISLWRTGTVLSFLIYDRSGCAAAVGSSSRSHLWVLVYSYCWNQTIQGTRLIFLTACRQSNNWHHRYNTLNTRCISGNSWLIPSENGMTVEVRSSADFDFMPERRWWWCFP